jgi:hypothetical protein
MAVPKSLLEQTVDGGYEHFKRWLSYLRQTGTPWARATLAQHKAHPGLLQGAFMAGYMARSVAGKR